MKNIVVLSGAGISAESGIETFRDSDGMWEQYNIDQVATPYGWSINPELVTGFYNTRRKELAGVEPNNAHKIIAEFEKEYNVDVITQNVDDLHERAGSSKILHLHGELTKICSSKDKETDIRDIGYGKVTMGELAIDDSQLRPYIVWFHEPVPMIAKAINIVTEADYLIIVGTSFNVYPAASLYGYVKDSCKIFIVDPKASEYLNDNINDTEIDNDITAIDNVATKGMQTVKELIYDHDTSSHNMVVSDNK